MLLLPLELHSLELIFQFFFNNVTLYVCLLKCKFSCTYFGWTVDAKMTSSSSYRLPNLSSTLATIPFLNSTVRGPVKFLRQCLIPSSVGRRSPKYTLSSPCRRSKADASDVMVYLIKFNFIIQWSPKNFIKMNKSVNKICMWIMLLLEYEGFKHFGVDTLRSLMFLSPQGC